MWLHRTDFENVSTDDIGMKGEAAFEQLRLLFFRYSMSCFQGFRMRL
ncbi:MAG: hypothetical protein ACI9XZ_004338, partial [Alphaproteobacteria bacterium]